MKHLARKGFTLTEIMVAVVILGLATFTVVSSVTYTTRSSRLNSNRMVAKNIAQGFLERMMNDSFDLVGPVGVGTGTYANIATTANPGVYLDQAMGIKCGVTFTFKGYGQAEAATSTTLTDLQANWKPGEWIGAQVYIVENGYPMFSTITGNTATTLTFNTMPFPMANNVKFMINNGKTVTVTTNWTYLGVPYTQEMQGLIVKQSQGDKLGF